MSGIALTNVFSLLASAEFKSNPALHDVSSTSRDPNAFVQSLIGNNPAILEFLYLAFASPENTNDINKDEHLKAFVGMGNLFMERHPEMRQELGQRVHVIGFQNDALFAELRDAAKEIGRDDIVKDIEAAYSDSTVNNLATTAFGYPGLAGMKSKGLVDATAQFRNDLSAIIRDPENRDLMDHLTKTDPASGEIVSSILGPEGSAALDSLRASANTVDAALRENAGGLDMLVDKWQQHFMPYESRLQASAPVMTGPEPG